MLLSLAIEAMLFCLEIHHELGFAELDLERQDALYFQLPSVEPLSLGKRFPVLLF